jgi:hypothetical protein
MSYNVLLSDAVSDYLNSQDRSRQKAVLKQLYEMRNYPLRGNVIRLAGPCGAACRSRLGSRSLPAAREAGPGAALLARAGWLGRAIASGGRRPVGPGVRKIQAGIGKFSGAGSLQFDDSCKLWAGHVRQSFSCVVLASSILPSFDGRGEARFK